MFPNSKLCNEVGDKLKPNRIVTNFEKGLRNSYTYITITQN